MGKRGRGERFEAPPGAAPGQLSRFPWFAPWADGRRRYAASTAYCRLPTAYCPLPTCPLASPVLIPNPESPNPFPRKTMSPVSPCPRFPLAAFSGAGKMPALRSLTDGGGFRPARFSTTPARGASPSSTEEGSRVSGRGGGKSSPPGSGGAARERGGGQQLRASGGPDCPLTCSGAVTPPISD
jgi:hypothetical protein